MESIIRSATLLTNPTIMYLQQILGYNLYLGSLYIPESRVRHRIRSVVGFPTLVWCTL